MERSKRTTRRQPTKLPIMDALRLPPPAALAFTICVDQREQRPYDFGCMIDKAAVPFAVRSGFLQSGDYSVDPAAGAAEEYETSRDPRDGIAIERKSLQDLYSTLGSHRDRFEAEWERLSRYGHALVVIEAELSQIKEPNKFLNHPTNLNPKSVINTLLAWQLRYGVHWVACPGRGFAEQLTFRVMEKWVKEGARKAAMVQVQREGVA